MSGSSKLCQVISCSVSVGQVMSGKVRFILVRSGCQ